MDWYKFYMGDYNRDTADLDNESHGIYRRLIDHYYATEKPLPLDHESLYRIVSAIRSEEQVKVDAIIVRFFCKKRAGYCKERIQEEIKNYHKRLKINRKNASKSHSESVSESHSEWGGEHQKPETSNQNKEKNNKKEFELPPWIPEDLWLEWMEIRKKKKAINTPRAMTALVNHLDTIRQAGYSPEFAISKAIERSWKGIELEWLQNTAGAEEAKAKPETPFLAAKQKAKAHGLEDFRGMPHETQEQFIDRINQSTTA